LFFAFSEGNTAVNVSSRPLIVVGLLLVLSGCATKGYVNEQNEALGTRVNGDLMRLDTRLGSLDGRVARTETELANAAKLGQDALERANAAHRLAEGKLLYEVTLTDDQYKFRSDSATMGEAAFAALEALATKLKTDNKNAFIEIQGHTDARGDKTYNKQLGLRRAEAVRDALYGLGIPLHRMSTISYGSSLPAVKGKGRDANAQNRRVVLLVLS